VTADVQATTLATHTALLAFASDLQATECILTKVCPVWAPNTGNS
jgi:hypothetical protein